MRPTTLPTEPNRHLVGRSLITIFPLVFGIQRQIYYNIFFTVGHQFDNWHMGKQNRVYSACPRPSRCYYYVVVKLTIRFLVLPRLGRRSPAKL